jgi:hypothetical protein
MSDAPLTMSASPIIDGRSCGTCTLCCKILSIAELAKPQGRWCKHCDIGRGCKIYDGRLDECRNFYCGYLTWSMLDRHWLPENSKMVVVSELEGMRIAIHVDPGRPLTWREEPFFSEIKEWSRHAVEEMRQIVVMQGKRAIVIFPDREVDLGTVSDDERIITAESKTGLRLEALKMKADDPRIAGLAPGKVITMRSRPIE